MTSTNKTRIAGAVIFQGFHFIYEPHPDNDQHFVTNALDNTAQLTPDNPNIINPLFEDLVTKEKLVDNAPTLL